MAGEQTGRGEERRGDEIDGGGGGGWGNHLFRLEDGQTVIVGLNAAHEQVVAVVEEVVRRDGAADVGRRVHDKIDAHLGGSVWLRSALRVTHAVVVGWWEPLGVVV